MRAAEEIRVLYVDDEPSLLEVTKEFLQMEGGMTVETSDDAQAVLVNLNKQHFDVIISDYQMPTMDGLSFLKAVREKGDGVPFILFTGKGREDVAIQALNNGADFYLQKGGDPIVQFKELRNIVKQLHKRSEAERMVTTREEQLEMLYHASQQLYATLDLDTIYRTMRDYLSMVMACDGMIVSSFSPREKLITCRYFWTGSTTLDVSELPPIPLEDEGRGIQSQVIRSGKPLLIDDYIKTVQTARTNYYISDEGEVSKKEPDKDEIWTRSAVVAPLKHENQVIGVVQVLSNRANSYNEDHLKLLESLAAHASAAISIASYFNQMKFETAERSRAESLTNLYRNIVMGMREGFILGRCLYPTEKMSVVAVIMNPSAAEMVGVKVEEFMGQDISERFRQRFGVDLTSHCEKVIRTGESSTIVSGELNSYRLKLFPLGNDCVGIVLDGGKEI
jgi:DNA-binding response OmpR family regulator/PAS domain-containing protein